jgi:fatty acyl-CoA reductase
MTQQWYFKNDRVIELWQRMSAVDREIFEFNMSDFNWGEYVKRMVRGIRVFISKNLWNAVEKGLTEYMEF